MMDCSFQLTGLFPTEAHIGGQKVPKRRKRNVFWTDEETNALEEGVRMFGRQWSKILRIFPRLHSRTGQRLKDKAVNEYKRRRRSNEDLGGFVYMLNE